MTERMQKVLVALLQGGATYAAEFGMTGNEIGYGLGFESGSDRYAKDGRMPGPANRINFSVIGLRDRGLVTFAPRRSLTGTAYALTRQGEQEARRIMGEAKLSDEQEMIAARCKREGLTIQEWTVTDDGDTAKLGSFTVTSNEHEDDGIYEGDEGELTACVVGSAQYHNQRVSFGFTPEGCDSPNEVRDLLVLDPIT